MDVGCCQLAVSNFSAKDVGFVGDYGETVVRS
jgi:hypothetical protein